MHLRVAVAWAFGATRPTWDPWNSLVEKTVPWSKLAGILEAKESYRQCLDSEISQCKGALWTQETQRYYGGIMRVITKDLITFLDTSVFPEL